MRTALIVVLALTAAGARAGTDAPRPLVERRTAPDTLPPGVAPALVAEGRQLFTGDGFCSSCHGTTGRGVIGPDLGDGEWWHGDGSYEAITRTVTSGVAASRSRTGMAMPARGGARLSDAQVRAVAAYVWTLRIGRDSTEAPAASHEHRARHRHRAGECSMAATGAGCRH